MAAERLVEECRLHEREGRAPAVDRVRVICRVTDREESGCDRTIPVDEASQTVSELPHHEDRRRGPVDRRRDGARAPGRDRGKRAQERLEPRRVRQAVERGVVDRGADADRERRAVAGEDRDLHPPEVTGDQSGRAARRAAAVQAVEARVVEHAGVRAELVRRRGVDRAQPLRAARAPPGGVDHQRRRQHGAVGESHAVDRGTPAVAPRGRQARDGHPLAQLDAGSHAHAFAERPFEGRAPAGEEDDFLVAVLVGERDAGRRDLREAELADTERAQAVEQLGEVGKKDEAETGEERMRMAELWNAGALPGAEGRLRIAAVRPDVALEDDDPRVVAGEKASRRKARNAAAEDDGRRIVGRHAHRPPIAVGVWWRPAAALPSFWLRGGGRPIARRLGGLQRLTPRMQAQALESRDGFFGSAEWRDDLVEGRRERRPLVRLVGTPDGRRAAEGDCRETCRGCNAASSHVASLLQEAGRARGSRDAGAPRRDSRRPHDRAAGTAHSALRHQGAVGYSFAGRRHGPSRSRRRAVHQAGDPVLDRAGHPGS